MTRVSKEKQPLISIIVPVYNGEKYIKKNLDILINIDCNKEIIVINDCSKDKSLEILKQYKNDIILIDLKKNQGVSNARNRGIERAKGKYIGFVDIDDSIEPNMFSKMLKRIEKTNSDVCVCNYDEIFENNEQTVNSKYDLNYDNLRHKDALSLFLIDKISPAIWDKIYKKELLLNIRFDKDLAVGEDILFCLNVFLHAQNTCFINEKLYHYLQQDSSVMHTISPKLLQFKNVVKSIDKSDLSYLKENFPKEYTFFELEMITRGIHSISTLTNRKNKKQAQEYLKTYCDKKNLDRVIKCEYYSKSVKLEILVLRIFGIKMHLLFMPIYKLIRSKIR